MIIRTVTFILPKHVRRQIVRKFDKRRRVWPVFVFAAVFGVVSAIVTKPHDARHHAPIVHVTSNR